MRIRLLPRRSARYRQPGFRFLERTLERERKFKWAIILATAMAVAVVLRILPWGRYLAAQIENSSSAVMRKVMGARERRVEIDQGWKNLRRLGIEATRPRVAESYAASDPGLQRIWRYAGMDPEHGLLRWANFDWTILLSSKVFAVDETGRSYTFRPRTRSVWLTNVRHAGGVLTFYIVPDGPGLAEAIAGTGAVPLESSRQTTNSWGLRGPELDPDAPLRGLILGDSFMQGMFIGDDETPPQCLTRYLEKRRNTRVSLANGGVMGYSPEQYYYTLIALADRFRPHFVVVSVCANDFGNMLEAVTKGVADWKEGKYWLEKIALYCRLRKWPCLFAMVPTEPSLLSRRNSGHFPGRVVNELDVDSRLIIDPMDDFVDAHLKSRVAAERRGETPKGCILFNNPLNDHHFSAAGSVVWAESVGRRVLLLLDDVGLYTRDEGAG